MLWDAKTFKNKPAYLQTRFRMVRVRDTEKMSKDAVKRARIKDLRRERNA
jgi:hypothetical protein